MQLIKLISVENYPQNNPVLKNKKEEKLCIKNRKRETNGGSLKITNAKEFTFLFPPVPDGAFQTDFRGEEL